MFTPTRKMTLVIICFLCLSLLAVWPFTGTPTVVEAQSATLLAPPYYGTVAGLSLPVPKSDITTTGG